MLLHFQVYLFELTHVDMRGMAAAMFALSNAIGFSLMAFLGAVLPQWRIDMAIMASISLVGFAAICFLPESPIWLLRKGRREEAEKSMMMSVAVCLNLGTDLLTT